MRNINKVRAVSLSVIAASLTVAFGSAYAQDDVISRLIRPESSVSVGLGYLTEDAARFGQYSGLRDEGLYALADVKLIDRDDATGRWLRFDARSLGLDSRSLRFEHSIQGSWKYFLDYDQTPRYSQYEVRTGLQGIGHDFQRVNGVPMREKRLHTDREALSFGGQYALGNGWDVRLKLKQDTKQGDRLYGAYPVNAKHIFLAEPIDHTMRQIDLVLGYAGSSLQLSAGYYGSFFDNGNSALRLATNPAGTQITNLGTARFDRLALAPDNYAHQFYLDGGYTLTPTTRANFKIARSFAYQDDSFIERSVRQPRVDSLDGKLETTLIQFGLSARPLQKLSLVADWRYENRDDRTTQRRYFDPAASRTFNGFNETRDFEVNTGKLEARYMLPAGFKFAAGIDYDEKKRDAYDVRLTSTRKRTEELGYRVELSRSLSDTVNGSVSVIQSERSGSRLLKETSAATSYYAVPYHLADRDREKVRMRLDWMPLEVLSFQLTADAFDDDYKDGGYGIDKGRGSFWSLDGTWVFAADWDVHGWASREYSRQVNQTRGAGNRDWLANLQVQTEAFGVGVKGKVGSRWKLGGDLSYSHNLNQYGLTGAAITPAMAINDVKFTVTTLKLFAEYEMRKDLSLRFDAVHDQWSTNDWQWANFIYTSAAPADGTTLSQDETQETTFVGVTMRYKWR